MEEIEWKPSDLQAAYEFSLSRIACATRVKIGKNQRRTQGHLNRGKFSIKSKSTSWSISPSPWANITAPPAGDLWDATPERSRRAGKIYRDSGYRGCRQDLRLVAMEICGLQKSHCTMGQRVVE
jgi:hypothetical protein